jgi:proteasome accessory factor A
LQYFDETVIDVVSIAFLIPTSSTASVDVQRRIFGVETEYGVTCTLRGQRRLSPDEVSRYLFRRVVSWGRSSNVFLENGSRLYLDVGSHPEYATAECDSITDLVAQDKAGERILENLSVGAEDRLREEGIRGTIHLFKNNADFAGNSYGCHENYLTLRETDTSDYGSHLIPFLISRQIYSGAGHVLQTARGPIYSIAQRSEHVWESMSSATTRSRPIINTRDEPHADPEKFRRLHVIVGDSNMSEYTNYLKIGSTSCMLMMLETKGVALPDFTLENPIRAIRDMSLDLTCRRRVRLATGREVSALDIQRSYLDQALVFDAKFGFPPEERRALDMWLDAVETIESDPLKLDKKIDWVIKHRLVESFMTRHSCRMDDPRVHMLDLQYHDIRRDRGIYYKLQDRGLVDRIVTDDRIDLATTEAPRTTRAHLRSQFIKKAKARKRDYTVDWVHLKLNDQAQRTVMCKDPFKSTDERVEKLIDSI